MLPATMAAELHPGLILDTLCERSELRSEIREAAVDWLLGLARWSQFVTLTFERNLVYADVARRYFKGLIRALNTDAFGSHYTNKVGHCYFSYVLATQRQERGAIHFHFLADRPIHYEMIHRWWQACAGFAYIKPVEDQVGVVRYVTRYILRRGDLDVYMVDRPHRMPKIKMVDGSYSPPFWWR